jgi:hypothetical protein
VCIEDVEAAAAVHQHLGEPRVADDGIDDQLVLARVGDAVRVILAAEGDGVLRPIEEGRRSPLCRKDLMPLPLALAIGHVYRRPPEDEEDILHRREAAGTPITTILLGLILFHGDAAVVFSEHVALLKGVVDRGLVVRTRLLQHVVKHAETSRDRSRALAGRVDREGLVLVLVAPLRACVAAGLLAFLAPLMLMLGLLGLVALLSHPILQGKPNASHMCARINLHTHDRQNESNTIAVIKRTRV